MGANIRLLQDGGRTIIVIDGQDIAITEAVNAFVSMFLTGQLNHEGHASMRNEVPGLEPVVEEYALPTSTELDRMEAIASGNAVEPMKMSGGEYTGYTPVDALNRDGIKALAALFLYAKNLPKGEEKDAVSTACKTYLAGNFAVEVIRYCTREEKIWFIDTAEPITPLSSLSHGLGLMDWGTFKSVASDSNIDQLFDLVVASMQKRGN